MRLLFGMKPRKPVVGKDAERLSDIWNHSAGKG